MALKMTWSLTQLLSPEGESGEVGEEPKAKRQKMKGKPAKRKREERNTKKLDVGDLVWIRSYGGNEK